MTSRPPSRLAQKAARQFVCLLARITIEDYIDLVDPTDTSPEHLRAAFAKLERAVCRSEGVGATDISRYEQDVENAAPKKYRAAVRQALRRLSDAEAALLTVRQQCAYLIGREIGRRMR